MINHSICPLCSSDRISFFLRCTDHFLSGKDFELLKCSLCGFVFTGEHPDEQDIEKYYESEDYVSHDNSAKGLLNRIYFLVRRIMLSRKRRIIEKASGIRKGKILDIGCGTGYFAWTMKKGGWQVTGIEPNPKARDFGKEKFDIDVISPDQISDLPDHSFDAVTLWHVMEHLHDLFKYSDEIYRLLKPAGICIAALPNISSADAAYYGKSWAAYDVPRHLWHFATDTFRIFAERTNFIIAQIKSLPLDVFYISMLSEKNKGTRFSFIIGAIRGSGFALSSLFNKRKSSSLIYFLQKKCYKH